MTPIYSMCDSPLGPITLAAAKRGLSGVWFTQQKDHPDISSWSQQTDHPVLQQASQQLQAYFKGQRTTFNLPLDFTQGTSFCQSVWKALLKIPFGRTLSYGELGHAIGKPTAARAVGLAVGRNPISIIAPCHRVIGANGTLTGYAGGLDRKRALLKLEGVL